jgi:hypothetical protein
MVLLPNECERLFVSLAEQQRNLLRSITICCGALARSYLCSGLLTTSRRLINCRGRTRAEDDRAAPFLSRLSRYTSPIAGALAMSSLDLHTPLTAILITSGIASEYCFPECFLTTSGR